MSADFSSRANPEHLHPIRVLSIDDEFREGMVLWGTQEKYREGIAQRGRYDQLRRRNSGAKGAEPRAEGSPHEPGHGGGQILKQSLRDDARVNEQVVGADLALDGIAILV